MRRCSRDVLLRERALNGGVADLEAQRRQPGARALRLGLRGALVHEVREARARGRLVLGLGACGARGGGSAGQGKGHRK